jgi:choline dehydrogenase-like flavoprotein
MSGERVIVIGTGPAGATAARELVRQGIPVTVLESGTVKPSGLLVRAWGRNIFRRRAAAASDRDAYVNAGHPDTSWFQHLQPGGLSSQWAGAVPRFAPQDFCEGERIHERYRWPLTYAELAAYYDDVEALLDITASPEDAPALPAGHPRHQRHLPLDWQAIGRVARRHGQGLTALPIADGPDWLLTRRGTAFNSFSTIIGPLLGSPLFQLRTGAHVLRLEWSGARRAIEGVVFHDRTTGRQERLQAAAVVVACGSLRSTKLLFDSACPDFPEGLGNTDGLLGRYLHDHPMKWWSFQSDRPLSRLSPSGYLTRRPYESSPPLVATSWTIGHGNGTDLDKVLSLTPLRTHVVGVLVFGSMIPTEEHFVRPSSTSQDEFELPRLEIHIDFDRETLSNVERGRDHLLGLMAEAGYRCTLRPIVPQFGPGSAVHYGGTARMHRSRKYGVLDRWNRPFDIPNLVVSDASCFTTSAEKNPTLTAMALSARAARRLAHDLKTR